MFFGGSVCSPHPDLDEIARAHAHKGVPSPLPFLAQLSSVMFPFFLRTLRAYSSSLDSVVVVGLPFQCLLTLSLSLLHPLFVIHVHSVNELSAAAAVVVVVVVGFFSPLMYVCFSYKLHCCEY